MYKVRVKSLHILYLGVLGEFSPNFSSAKVLLVILWKFYRVVFLKSDGFMPVWLLNLAEK